MPKPSIHKIYDALEKAGALEGYWSDPDYHCFRQFPPVVREMMATHALESELSNGGPSQLLMHMRPHWREFLALSFDGYNRIGAGEAMKQVRKLQKSFEKAEPLMDKFMVANGQKPRDVGEWMYVANLTIFKEVGEFPDEITNELREDFLKSEIREIVAGIKISKQRR